MSESSSHTSDTKSKPAQMNLHVTYGDQYFELNHFSTENVWMLKTAIKTKTNLPEENQHLTSDGVEPSSDDLTLWGWASDCIEKFTGEQHMTDMMERKIRSFDITLTRVVCDPSKKPPKSLSRVEYKMIEFSGQKAIVPKSFSVSTELQDVCQETIKEVKLKAEPVSRQKDVAELKKMVFASKCNEFERVFDIVREKGPHLINGIPEERAWSALHQAVHYGDIGIVKEFLSFDNCDVNVYAKRDKDGLTEEGETPIQLAERQGKEEIQKLLLDKKGSTENNSQTFVPLRFGQKYIHEGMPLFWMATAFLPEMAVMSLANDDCFLAQTKKLLAVVKDHFQAIKNALGETMYPFCQDLHTKIQDATDFTNLFEIIINIYTSPHIYKQVNVALRRSSENLNPTGNDLLFCLFAFLLESILLHWDSLKKYAGISYRECALEEDEVTKYEEGIEFMWMSFTSSSKSKSLDDFTGNTRFIIDNQADSDWSPREISKFSWLEKEEEVLYPAGAKFKVTGVNRGPDCVDVNIKLLQ